MRSSAPAICWVRAAAAIRVNFAGSMPGAGATESAVAPSKLTVSRGSPERPIPGLIASPSPATSATTLSPPRVATTAMCAALRANGTWRARPESWPPAPTRMSPSSCTGAIVIGPCGDSIPACARSQPASSVSAIGTGAANRPATRSTANPSAISAPAPPRLVGDPGQRQRRTLRAHLPQRHWPLALLGLVDRVSLAQGPGRSWSRCRR